MDPTEHGLEISIWNKSDYELVLNGMDWDEIAETDYLLLPGWCTVQSKSSGKVRTLCRCAWLIWH